MENILQELRLAGYVESKRGKEGGCRLAKPMEEITIGEVVRLIDGRLAPIGWNPSVQRELDSRNGSGERMFHVEREGGGWFLGKVNPS